jgi:hypothetical protein
MATAEITSLVAKRASVRQSRQTVCSASQALVIAAQALGAVTEGNQSGSENERSTGTEAQATDTWRREQVQVEARALRTGQISAERRCREYRRRGAKAFRIPIPCRISMQAAHTQRPELICPM